MATIIKPGPATTTTTTKPSKIKKAAEIQVKPKITSPNQDTEFGKEIPPEIRQDIGFAVSQTAQDMREKGMAFCRIHDDAAAFGITEKIHTASYAKGDRGSTEVKPCDKKFGKSEKVGDFHSHPADAGGIGTTPSEGDYTSNLIESREYNIKQISCISNDKSKYINCFQPRSIPDAKKVRKYTYYLGEIGSGNNTPAFYRDNIYKDFTHTWYDRHTFQRVDPSAKDVIHDALGQAKTRLRNRDIKDIEKGIFCDMIQDYTKPSDNNVGIECRKELKRQSIVPRIANNITPIFPGKEEILPALKSILTPPKL